MGKKKSYLGLSTMGGWVGEWVCWLDFFFGFIEG